MPFLLPKTQLPPTRSPLSKQSNGTPRWWRTLAAVIPEEPAPMMQTSGFDMSTRQLTEIVSGGAPTGGAASLRLVTRCGMTQPDGAVSQSQGIAVDNGRALAARSGADADYGHRSRPRVVRSRIGDLEGAAGAAPDPRRRPRPAPAGGPSARRPGRHRPQRLCHPPLRKVNPHPPLAAPRPVWAHAPPR